jgi:hypothetical protein
LEINENQPDRFTYERILKQILHYRPKDAETKEDLGKSEMSI